MVNTPNSRIIRAMIQSRKVPFILLSPRLGFNRASFHFSTWVCPRIRGGHAVNGFDGLSDRNIPVADIIGHVGTEKQVVFSEKILGAHLNMSKEVHLLSCYNPRSSAALTSPSSRSFSLVGVPVSRFQPLAI